MSDFLFSRHNFQRWNGELRVSYITDLYSAIVIMYRPLADSCNAVSNLHLTLVNPRNNMKRIDHFHDVVSSICWFLLEDVFGPLKLIDFLSEIHLVPNHSLRIFIFKGLFTELDDLHLIETKRW